MIECQGRGHKSLFSSLLEGHGRVSCTHSALVTEVAHTAGLNLLF